MCVRKRERERERDDDDVGGNGSVEDSVCLCILQRCVFTHMMHGVCVCMCVYV